MTTAESAAGLAPNAARPRGDARPLDDDVAAVEAALARYRGPTSARSAVRVERPHWSELLVTVRSDEFAGLTRDDRGDRVWPLLDGLDDSVYTQITRLTLLAPGEADFPDELDDESAAPAYHRTGGPRPVWAVTPPASGETYHAAYTFEDAPRPGGTLTFVPDGNGGRAVYPSSADAARAAFAAAEAAATVRESAGRGRTEPRRPATAAA